MSIVHCQLFTDALFLGGIYAGGARQPTVFGRTENIIAGFEGFVKKNFFEDEFFAADLPLVIAAVQTAAAVWRQSHYSALYVS